MQVHVNAASTKRWNTLTVVSALEIWKNLVGFVYQGCVSTMLMEIHFTRSILQHVAWVCVLISVQKVIHAVAKDVVRYHSTSTLLGKSTLHPELEVCAHNTYYEINSHLYPCCACSQEDTDNGAPYIGKVVKVRFR